MALITLTALANALRIGASTAETEELTRLNDYAVAVIERNAPDAPDVIKSEAIVRLVGYLYDVPTVARGTALANSFGNSGAAAILLPYRVQRAGSVGEAVVIAAASGSPGNPVTGLSIAGTQLTVTFADGATTELTLPSGGSGGGANDNPILGVTVDGATLTFTYRDGSREEVEIGFNASIRDYVQLQRHTWGSILLDEVANQVAFTLPNIQWVTDAINDGMQLWCTVQWHQDNGLVLVDVEDDQSALTATEGNPRRTTIGAGYVLYKLDRTSAGGYNPDLVARIKSDTNGCQINGASVILWAAHFSPVPALADNSVTTAKLHKGAVTDVKLASNAVTNAKLAANAVTGSKIKDGEVGNSKLSGTAVTRSKLVAAENIPLPTGGTAGQVLTKKSATVGDAEWKDAAGGGSGGAKWIFEATFIVGTNQWTGNTSINAIRNSAGKAKYATVSDLYDALNSGEISQVMLFGGTASPLGTIGPIPHGNNSSTGFGNAAAGQTIHIPISLPTLGKFAGIQVSKPSRYLMSPGSEKPGDLSGTQSFQLFIYA